MFNFLRTPLSGIAIILVIAAIVALAVAPVLMKPSVSDDIAIDATLRQEAIDAARIHFHNPFQQILAWRYTITERRPDGYVLTGWTMFGIRLTQAIVYDQGGITTL